MPRGGKREGAGRPPKNPDEIRATRRMISFTEEEDAALWEAARERSIPLGDLIRAAALREIGFEAKEGGSVG